MVCGRGSQRSCSACATCGMRRCERRRLSMGKRVLRVRLSGPSETQTDTVGQGTSTIFLGITRQLMQYSKNIVALDVTENRVFALSASGSIYVLASSQSKQNIASNPFSAPWWNTGWLWGEVGSGVDFSELVCTSRLSWGERFGSRFYLSFPQPRLNIHCQICVYRCWGRSLACSDVFRENFCLCNHQAC